MQEYACDPDAARNGGDSCQDRAGIRLHCAHDLPEDGETDASGKGDQDPNADRWVSGSPDPGG